MLTIHCRAMARYQGRIDAELGLGDLVLIVKRVEDGGDGSVVVHGPSLVTPRNWMPAGTIFREEPGYLCFEHPERGEILEIWVEEEYHRHPQPVGLTGVLTKLGAEQEFSDLLAEQPWRLEEGLQLIAREYRTPAGPVDLLCISKDGQAVAVEVKRRTIDLSALWQLKRYLAHLEGDKQWAQGVRGILVGPHLRNNCREHLAQEKEIGFCRLGFEDL